MLSRLTLKNFRNFATLDLDLCAGLSVFTGETGSGKSLLTQAIALATGARSSAQFVGKSAPSTEILCWFQVSDNPRVKAFMADQEIDLEEDEQCVLRRIIKADGNSKAYINGSPVPLSVLERLSAELVDIVAQNQNHALHLAQTRLALVDGIWHSETELKQLSALWREVTRLQQELDTLNNTPVGDASALAQVRFQIEELDQVDITPLTVTQNLRQHKIQQSSAALASGIAQAQNLIEEVVDNALGQATQALSASQLGQEVASLPEITQITESIDELRTLANEVALNLNKEAEESVPNEAKKAELESWMTHVYGLSRKHNTQIENLHEIHTQLKEQLKLAESMSTNRKALEKEHEKAHSAWEKQANLVSAKRSEAARELIDRAQSYLPKLALDRAQIGVNLVPTPPKESGIDRCDFWFKNDPLSPERSMHGASSSVSGGEFTRLNFALRLAGNQPPTDSIKAQTLQQQTPSLLILDEVDAGIGGEVAVSLGKLLQQIASNTQVLCVTHLGSLAAHAAHQYAVHTQDATTCVSEVSGVERTAELARMLAGDSEDSALRDTAEKLLQTHAPPASAI